MKQCNACKQTLPEDNFSNENKCIKCIRFRGVKWRKNNPYKYLLNKLKATERTRGNTHSLSVTSEDIEALVKSSDLRDEDPRKLKIARKDEKEPWTLENSCVKYTRTVTFQEKGCGSHGRRKTENTRVDDLFWCSVCQQHLPIGSFTKSRLASNRTICGQCSRLRASMWEKQNQYNRMLKYMRANERKRGVVGDIHVEIDDIKRFVEASEYSDKDPSELSLARKDRSVHWSLENCRVKLRPIFKRPSQEDTSDRSAKRKIE